jgi:hypothetical protein
VRRVLREGGAAGLGLEIAERLDGRFGEGQREALRQRLGDRGRGRSGARSGDA